METANTGFDTTNDVDTGIIALSRSIGVATQLERATDKELDMLSQENIEKLHMNGIYRCTPVLEWIPSYKRDNPYWCKNWTFRVKESKSGKFYMYDTYWSTGDEYPVELTDENFDKFEFLFNLDEIRYVNSYGDWCEYSVNDRWRVPLDSGGMEHAKYVVRRWAKKVKQCVIERMQREISYLKQDLSHKEIILEGIISGDIDYNMY